MVAIDPAAFSQAITVALPSAAISVDPFHLVQQANLMVASVRKHDLDVRHDIGATRARCGTPQR